MAAVKGQLDPEGEDGQIDSQVAEGAGGGCEKMGQMGDHKAGGRQFKE